ncbi:2-methylcitrate dehydratase PrpD [Rhizobiales bacterium GAS188]|nr:2-methylcitrate dehydratase PrpD [Rhizobiales bacterium GAS188]
MNAQATEGWVLQLSCLLTDIGRSELPEAATKAAKNRLLHAFGVSLANSRLPAAEVAWKTMGGSSGPCFAFGRERRIDAGDAAFINGVIGHGSLLEDCGPGGLREGSHPGTFVIPAALAAAESCAASGKTFIAGLVVGYEAVSRIGAAASSSVVQRRFRPVGIMAAFGAAAAAAMIFEAEAEQMAAALSIAANLAGGSTQGIFEGTMEPYFQAGFGARNGLFAARLALAGAATTRQALEGEFGFFQTYGGEPGKLDALLGPRPQLGIAVVGTKRFAVCLQNQQTLALIVDGLDAPLTADVIERVVIRRPQFGTNGLNSPGVSRSAPFDNMLSAQMSARFTAAAAILGKPVDDPVFFNSHHADKDITELTRRIDLEPAADDSVAVELHLRNGRKVALDANKSGVLFPDDDVIRDSFLRRARSVQGGKASTTAELIDELGTLNDVGRLTEAMAMVRAHEPSQLG